ncbi:MAG: hypothetical protein R6X17_00365, partial [Candidatus Competibacteraceae bacterium]
MQLPHRSPFFTAPPTHQRDTLAGVLLTLMIAASVLPGGSLWLAGSLGWTAALLLSHRLARRQRIQSAWLIGLGGASIVWGILHGAPFQLNQALAGN